MAVCLAISTPRVRAQDPNDCNNDGIPDDILGIGRLFFDTFPSIHIDSDKWMPQQSLVTVDGVGIDEPTEPYALHIDGYTNGSETIETVPMDLSAATGAVLSYAWHRTGGGDQPISPRIGSSSLPPRTEPGPHWRNIPATSRR